MQMPRLPPFIVLYVVVVTTLWSFVLELHFICLLLVLSLRCCTLGKVSSDDDDDDDGGNSRMSIQQERVVQLFLSKAQDAWVFVCLSVGLYKYGSVRPPLGSDTLTPPEIASIHKGIGSSALCFQVSVDDFELNRSYIRPCIVLCL